MACINIPTLIEESTGEGATVDYSGECSTECIPMWRDSGSAVCINGESKIPQIDGCGNSRMVLGGEACCIPKWAPTGKEKCENAISFREEFDGCGEYRWVQGGSACCIPKWVVTPTARCLDGVSQQLWVDGCSSSEWRAGGNACPPKELPPLETTGVYTYSFYANGSGGYWSSPHVGRCDTAHKVWLADVDTSPHAAMIKQLALQGAKITLREQWIDGAPYLGKEWPASAGAVKMLRFDVNGTGPEVGYLSPHAVGELGDVILVLYGGRTWDNIVTFCKKTSLTYPVDGSTGTYLGLHSLVVPPQANGADYRVAPFMSNLWKDAEGYHFVSVDTRYRNDNTSAYVGQCVGIKGDSAAMVVPDIAIWSCGITSSRKVLEFDATCVI